MRSRKIFCFKILSSLSLIYSFSVFSQEDKSFDALITDRPDQTEASSTVKKGVIQIETGAFFETYEENRIKTENVTYNTTLVRYGVSDNFEFRLGWDFQESTTFVNGQKLNDVTSGFSPLLLGMKVYILLKKKDGCPKLV